MLAETILMLTIGTTATYLYRRAKYYSSREINESTSATEKVTLSPEARRKLQENHPPLYGVVGDDILPLEDIQKEKEMLGAGGGEPPPKQM